MSGRRVPWYLLGGVTWVLVASGCAATAAQHEDALRLSEELGRARAQVAWERERAAEVEARAAQLESRVARLERGESAAATTRSLETSRILDRLDRVLEVTEKMAEERKTTASATPPLETKSAPATPTALRGLVPADGGPDLAAATRDSQLRALIKGLLGPSGNAPALSADEERALRLLLRSDRKLDTNNPWPSALY